MSEKAGPRPARVTIQRRIEWIDTDAAGIYHWTTACRFAEAAEAELHRELVITQLTFGVTPRVSVHFDFERRLRFDDPVTVELLVDRVGRTSIGYAITISGPEGIAARGSMVTCLVDAENGDPIPLPPELRSALTESGLVST